MITVANAALAELQQALESCTVSFRGIRVVCDTLPGRAICATTVKDGVLWLVLDFDKPSAHRHALAMLQEAKRAACADEGELSDYTPNVVINERVPLALVG